MDTVSAAQQPYRNRKGKATSMQISILVKHEHRYTEYCEAVGNMPNLPEHTVTRYNKTP